MLKRPLILFSGGLDSSYLLGQELLRTDVDIMYVIGPQSKIKAQAELRAASAIIDWYFRNRPHVVINRYVHTQHDRLVPTGAVHGEIFAWFCAAMLVADADIHDSVELAYVADDINVPCLDNLITAWDNLVIALKPGKIPLKFPLRGITKQTLIRECDPEIFNLTWVCEEPLNTSVQCGECTPCLKRHFDLLEFNAS